MKKYWMPLSYLPKIPGVLDGTITQTIREKRKRNYQVGDLVAFHGWTGKPYRSPWSFRTEYHTLSEVIDVLISKTGLKIKGDPLIFFWNDFRMDHLASLDGIVPATGEELKNVLLGMHERNSRDWLNMQVLRWTP